MYRGQTTLENSRRWPLAAVDQHLLPVHGEGRERAADGRRDLSVQRDAEGGSARGHPAERCSAAACCLAQCGIVSLRTHRTCEHAAHMGCDTRGASSWTRCTLPSQLRPHGELQASR